MYSRMLKVDNNSAKRPLLTGVSKEWKESLDNYKSKLDVYKRIKGEFGVERYLQLNIDKYEKSLLSQTRYRILPLRIETGRFTNEPRENRICTLCNAETIETVEHFLFECSCYDEFRIPFVINARNRINNWENLSQIECLSKLFSTMPRALGKYVKQIFFAQKRYDL